MCADIKDLDMERSPQVQRGLVLGHRGLQQLKVSCTAPYNMLPGEPGLRHTTFARIVDITATICSLCGLADLTAWISEWGHKHK